MPIAQIIISLSLFHLVSCFKRETDEMDETLKHKNDMRLLYQRNRGSQSPQLDTSSHKVICPQCGRKTFVNFLFADGTPVADGECGRCDRKDKCRYHYPPRDYFRDHRPLSENNRRERYKPQRKTQNHSYMPTFINPNDMLATIRGYEYNNLAIFLHSVFDGLIGAQAVDAVLHRYAVGTTKEGKTCFWQVDESGKVRSGKVIAYNPTTGKRIKGYGGSNWAHSMMSDRYSDFKLEQAYFGTHLMREADSHAAINNQQRKAMNIEGEFKPVIWLLESEKAALITALYLAWGGCTSTFIPIATGGCENFNPTDEAIRNQYHRLQVLKGRKIAIFPDEGKFDEWKSKAEKLKGFCSEVYISTIMERSLHPVKIDCEIEQGDGFDDILLRYIKTDRIDKLFNLHFYGYHGQWKIV